MRAISWKTGQLVVFFSMDNTAGYHWQAMSTGYQHVVQHVLPDRFCILLRLRHPSRRLPDGEFINACLCSQPLDEAQTFCIHIRSYYWASYPHLISCFISWPQFDYLLSSSFPSLIFQGMSSSLDIIFALFSLRHSYFVHWTPAASRLFQERCAWWKLVIHET